MKTIAVIGAGTMGNGIAHVFAQNGFQVHLIDTQESALQKALATIDKNLDRQIAKNTITQEQKTKTLEAITTYQSIEDGILYVDEENSAALSLYKSLGFKQSGKDCLFKYKNPQ